MPELPLDFDLKTYDFEKYRWFNAHFVLEQFVVLSQNYPGQTDHYLFKKAVEATQGAIAILGAIALDEGNQFVMQMNRQTRRPDVIAGKHVFNKTGNDLLISPLEVTEMSERIKHNDIMKFLTDTKGNKTYPPETIIVCFINKKMPFTLEQLVADYKKSKFKWLTYFVSKVAGSTETSFLIATNDREGVKVNFDLVEMARKINLPPVLNLEENLENHSTGYVPSEIFTFDVFDFFMLDKERIIKKFGNGKATP